MQITADQRTRGVEEKNRKQIRRSKKRKKKQNQNLKCQQQIACCRCKKTSKAGSDPLELSHRSSEPFGKFSDQRDQDPTLKADRRNTIEKPRILRSKKLKGHL
jgi:hypothetical protein